MIASIYDSKNFHLDAWGGGRPADNPSKMSFYINILSSKV